MIKKSNCILISSKAISENNLFIKFITEEDESLNGIVYGGSSSKKKNIFQNGYFLNLSFIKKANKPLSVNGELTKPYISNIINDKYKLSSINSLISLINVSVYDNQKVYGLFRSYENFVLHILNNRRWINHYFIFLFNLLKMIGYEIDYLNNKDNKYFNLDLISFSNESSPNAKIFPHDLMQGNNLDKIDFYSINYLFDIFEEIFEKNHLINMNLNLPHHYIILKKLILNYLRENGKVNN